MIYAVYFGLVFVGCAILYGFGVTEFPLTFIALFVFSLFWIVLYDFGTLNSEKEQKK